MQNYHLFETDRYVVSSGLQNVSFSFQDEGFSQRIDRSFVSSGKFWIMPPYAFSLLMNFQISSFSSDQSLLHATSRWYLKVVARALSALFKATTTFSFPRTKRTDMLMVCFAEHIRSRDELADMFSRVDRISSVASTQTLPEASP